MTTPHDYIEQQVILPSPVLLSELMLHENHYNRKALDINRKFQRKNLAEPVDVLEDDVDPSVLAFHSGVRPKTRIPAVVVKGAPAVMREATEKNAFTPFKAISIDFANLVGTVENNFSKFGHGLVGMASRFLGHAPQQATEPEIPRDYENRRPVTSAKTMVVERDDFDTPWRDLNKRYNTDRDTQLIIVSVAIAAVLLFPLF